MFISEKLRLEIEDLEMSIDIIKDRKSITESQAKEFLKTLEKRRYNIINEIKLYNNIMELGETEKIKTIGDYYKVEASDDLLKIVVPEPMPSYRNFKTHAYKSILLNLINATKPYEKMFTCPIFIYIVIYDKIEGWDIDNKYIKLISDSLIKSKVILDDSIDKMFYCVKGEFSQNPRTEIYILPMEKMSKFMENIMSKKCRKN